MAQCRRPIRPWLLLLLLPAELAALNPTLPVRQYLHTSWTEAHGAALPTVNALAQDGQGYLWLATARGLYRFDGKTFFHWTPPAGESLPEDDLCHVAWSRRDGLWISSSSSVSRFQNGKLHRYPALDRTLGGKIISILARPGGGLWVLALGRDARGDTSALAALAADGTLHRFGPADGLPAAPVYGILRAGEGADLSLVLWSEVCRWSPGRPAACRPDAAAAMQPFDGRLILAAGQFLPQSPGEPAAPGHAPRNRKNSVWGALLRDESGNLWAGTNGSLLRLQDGRVERFTKRDGLSGNIVPALLEDREGDLWVATDGGIDRFRDPRAVHLSTADGLSGDLTSAVAAAPDGSVWVGIAGIGISRVQGGAIAKFLPAAFVTALFADQSGALWVATRRGVMRLVHGRFVAVNAPGGKPLQWVDAIGGQGGVVWLADENRGLFRVERGAVEHVPTPDFPALVRVAAARDGAVWLGSYRAGLMAVKPSGTCRYSPHAGPVYAIFQDSAGQIWAGIGPALGRFRNGKWTVWDSRHGLPGALIRGIVEDDRKNLWVLSSAALLRIPIAELDSAPDGSPRPLHFLSLTAADGLRLATTGMPSPRMATAADGRIWICESSGVAIVDPAKLRTNPVPPPVVIEQLTLEGQPLPAGGAPFSFRSGELHIAYNGISLMAPERVEFRYRLEPNRQWTYAGYRREVTYASLGPGNYRFQVAAANLDGLWNNAGAAVDFRVEPRFYQTVWFAAVCAFTALLSGLAVHRFRLRRLTARFQLVARERARMSREIHDSLLQGFMGVIFQLDAAARQFDVSPAESKQKLDGALDRADRVMQEARHVLSTMRLPVLEDKTLPEALQEAAAKATDGAGMAFQLKVNGTAVPLAYEAQANLFLIGREAIANAVNHSGGSRIFVQLIYSDRECRLIVQDNGAGFDPKLLREQPGHLGLRAMRERAGQIGAVFTLDAAPGRGTRIECCARF